MKRKPRDPKAKLLTGKILTKSVIQGLAIFAASFGTYYYTLNQMPENGAAARTMGLAIIMLANLFLVQVNSSDVDFAYISFKRLIKDKVMWGVNIGTVGGLFLILYTPLNEVLKLAPLSFGQLITALGMAAISVVWFEIFKIKKAK